jgi:hypothetical protein
LDISSLKPSRQRDRSAEAFAAPRCSHVQLRMEREAIRRRHARRKSAFFSRDGERLFEARRPRPSPPRGRMASVRRIAAAGRRALFADRGPRSAVA